MVSAVLCGCGIFALFGMSRVAGTIEALPVSLTDNVGRKPVIILDAGHGEST